MTVTTLALSVFTLALAGVLPIVRRPRVVALLVATPWAVALLVGALCAPQPIDPECMELERLNDTSTTLPNVGFRPDGSMCLYGVPEKCAAYYAGVALCEETSRRQLGEVVETVAAAKYILKGFNNIREAIRQNPLLTFSCLDYPIKNSVVVRHYTGLNTFNQWNDVNNRAEANHFVLPAGRRCRCPPNRHARNVESPRNNGRMNRYSVNTTSGDLTRIGQGEGRAQGIGCVNTGWWSDNPEWRDAYFARCANNLQPTIQGGVIAC